MKTMTDKLDPERLRSHADYTESLPGERSSLEMQYILDARASADRIEELTAERKRLRGLLWYGWSEMNAIRARSGVPLDFDGTQQGIAESYWDTLVEAMSTELGDETTPWPSGDAKAAIDFGALQVKGNGND